MALGDMRLKLGLPAVSPLKERPEPAGVVVVVAAVVVVDVVVEDVSTGVVVDVFVAALVVDVVVEDVSTGVVVDVVVAAVVVDVVVDVGVGDLVVCGAESVGFGFARVQTASGPAWPGQRQQQSLSLRLRRVERCHSAKTVVCESCRIASAMSAATARARRAGSRWVWAAVRA